MSYLIIVAIAFIVGIASTYKWGPDNIAEEVAEVVIEKELHLPEGSVDLTPENMRKK